jgi:hypothetical protein
LTADCQPSTQSTTRDAPLHRGSDEACVRLGLADCTDITIAAFKPEKIMRITERSLADRGGREAAIMFTLTVGSAALRRLSVAV